MRVELKGVGCLPDFTIECNGLTVISGINGTGKSTILKAIYSVLCNPVEYDSIKQTQIIDTLRFLKYRNNGSDDRDPGDLTIDELISDLQRSIEDSNTSDRSTLDYAISLRKGDLNDDFYNKIVEGRIRSEFDKVEQFRNIRSNRSATVRIKDGPSMECRVSKQNVVSCKGNRNNIPNVIYWDSPFNIDYQTFNFLRRNSNHRVKIWQMLNSIPDENLILEETYKANIEKFDKAISSAIKGYFVNTKDGLRYQLPDGYQLSVRNVASGIKVFGTIRMLVDKGFLNHNDILLLDEPEVHLHPLWINVLAESLTILTRDMGIKVLLTTHNPQLAMGLESRTRELDGLVSYYHLSDDGNGNIIAEDITDNLDVMYKEMSDPIEDAAAPFWE